MSAGVAIKQEEVEKSSHTAHETQDETEKEEEKSPHTAHETRVDTEKEEKRIAELRDSISSFVVGSICSKLNPTLASDFTSDKYTLRILLAGPTNAGKSSLILSIFTALENTGTVDWLRTDVSASRGAAQKMATTMQPVSHYIQIGTKNDKPCYIEIVDSRGAVSDEHFEEGYQYAAGDANIKMQQRRIGEEAHVPKFTNYVNPANWPNHFHAVIWVIPADMQTSLYAVKRVKAKIESAVLIPSLVVLTGTDNKAGQDYKETLEDLNVNENQVFKIVPYCSANAVFNSKTNLAVLEFLTAAIRAAERGLVTQRRAAADIGLDAARAVVNDAIKDVKTANISIMNVIFVAAVAAFFLLFWGFIKQ